MATNITYFPALQIFPWLYRKQESSLLLQSKTRFKHISLRLTKLTHQSWTRKSYVLCAEGNTEFCSQRRTAPAVPWPAPVREARPTFLLMLAASWAGLMFIWVHAEMTHVPSPAPGMSEGGCPESGTKPSWRGAPQAELHILHQHRLGQD